MSVALWLIALVLAGVVAVAVRRDGGEVDAEDFFWPAALFLAVVILFSAWWRDEEDDDDDDDDEGGGGGLALQLRV